MDFHLSFMLNLMSLRKMKKNRFRFFIFCYVLFVANVLFAQSTSLSYNDFLNNVLQFNPLAKRANNQKQYGDIQYKASKGNFDPFISADYSNKFFNNSNYYSVLSSSVKVPIFTSQNLKFGYEYGVGSNVNPEHYTSNYGLPYVGLEVGLLQGLMLDYRRAEVLKAKEYVGYYSAEKNIQLNNLLFESSLKYFDWLYSIKQISLNNYFLDLARQRLIGIESLANIGEKAAMDTIEASILYQGRLLDYQNVMIENQKALNDLANINWQSIASSNTAFVPKDSLDFYFEKTKLNLLKLLNSDTANNPVLNKYTSLQNILKIDNRIKKEMIKPRLNVNYNFLSYNPNSYSPVYTQNNYKWGVDFSFPLLLRKSRNEYKLSKLNAQNNEFEFQTKNNELNFKLNALKQTLAILSNQLQNADRAVRFNKQLVEAEKLKFNNGESSLFILNARENKWLESEQKLLDYKLKFIKTYFNVVYIKGNLNYQL